MVLTPEATLIYNILFQHRRWWTKDALMGQTGLTSERFDDGIDNLQYVVVRTTNRLEHRTPSGAERSRASSLLHEYRLVCPHKKNNQPLQHSLFSKASSDSEEGNDED